MLFMFPLSTIIILITFALLHSFLWALQVQLSATVWTDKLLVRARVCFEITIVTFAQCEHTVSICDYPI